MPKVVNITRRWPNMAAWLRQHRTELLTLSGLAIFAAIVLAIFRREPVFSDDLGYWTRWSSLDTRSGMANPHRLIMAFSAEVARWIFGYSMTAYNAVGIGYGIGIVILVYLLTRMMFPRIVGFAAVAMLLTSTVFLQDISLLVPDWASMFWFLAGIVLLLHAIPRDDLRIAPSWHRPTGTGPSDADDDTGALSSPSQTAVSTRRAWLLGIAAGLCFHLTVFAKEAAVPILLAVPLMMLLATGAKRAVRLTAIAAGSTMLFAIVELGIMWQLYGDPFRRFDVIMRGHVRRRLSDRLGGRVESTPDVAQTAPDAVSGSGVAAAEAAEAARTSFGDWWELAERYIDPISSTWNGTLLLWLTAFAAVVVLIGIRSRRLWFLAIPTILGLGAMVFGVGSINPLVPILSMKFRYIALGWVFLMPLIAASVWMAGTAPTRRLTSRAGVSAVTGLALLLAVAIPVTGFGVAAATNNPAFVVNGANGLAQAGRQIEELIRTGVPINHVITDGRTIQGLRMQLGGDPEGILDRSHSNFARAEPGDVLIVNRKREGLPTVPGGNNDPLPEWLLIPPPEWRFLGDADFTDIFIYYVDAAWTPPPTLSTTGRDMSQVTRGTQLDGDDAEFGWQREHAGVFLWMDNIRHARFVTGHGSHPRAAHSEGSEQLVITEPGRFGARVELHLTSDIRVGGVWLRTYDADGNMRQNARLYQATEEERTSVPQFAVDVSSMRPVSFAGSLEVDPALDKSFRVVGFASGSGILTIDRIAVTATVDG